MDDQQAQQISSPAEAMQQFNQILSEQVKQTMSREMTSPQFVNRVIGESMRHIGAFLEINSTGYLPARPEEVLTKPEKFRADSREAVLLLTRQMMGEKGFLVMVKSSTTPEGDRKFDLIAYKPDNFNLEATQFLNLPEDVGNEIIRQLNILVTGDGVALLQCLIWDNFFPEEAPAEKADTLFNSDLATPEVAAQTESAPAKAMVSITPGSLPPVTDEHLL